MPNPDARRTAPAPIARTLAVFLLASTADAAPPPLPELANDGFYPDRLESLHRGIERFVEDGKHAGVLTMLVHDGKVADVHATGLRDREKNLPVERDTIFRIYSMTKLVTSAVALSLYEKNLIDLDDPVSDYIPELANLQVLVAETNGEARRVPADKPVTVRHLFTHTAGFTYGFLGDTPGHREYSDANLWAMDSLEEFARRAATLPLLNQPGEAFNYGISTDLLGRVIEVAGGVPFDEAVADTITAPLGMHDTAFFVPAEKRDRLAVIYSHGEDGALSAAPASLGSDADEGDGFPSGGGGLFSTADDYARFAQMLLDGGALGDTRVLSRKTVELMTTVNHVATVGDGTHQFSDAHGFGLGVDLRTRLDRGASPGSVGQFGWYGAATTYVNIDKNERTVALLFAQHFPFDEHGVFAAFSTMLYSALR